MILTHRRITTLTDLLGSSQLSVESFPESPDPCSSSLLTAFSWNLDLLCRWTWVECGLLWCMEHRESVLTPLLSYKYEQLWLPWGPSQLLTSWGAFPRLNAPVDSVSAAPRCCRKPWASWLCCPDLIQIIFPLAYELELLKVLFSERVVCGGFFSILF